nr:hypothetical protein [Nocardia concava]
MLFRKDGAEDIDGEPECGGEFGVVAGDFATVGEAGHADSVADQLRRCDGAGVGERVAGTEEQLVRFVDHSGSADRRGGMSLRGDGVKGRIDCSRVDSGDRGVDVGFEGDEVQLDVGMRAVELL